MSNAKWFVFGLCFLALMAAFAVWYVEAKISQVSGLIDSKIDTAKDMVDGAVTQVSDTVQAPLRAVSGGLESAGALTRAAANKTAEGVDTTVRIIDWIFSDDLVIQIPKDE